ncbi:hydratase/decarboxylase [Pandoraea terrae]|uniref:Hydratase/decarboxylase n=1 Tax=Pandoraea terrae TaxID=1537710 RepID=A0A5E4TJP2_9BURK|nr:fumarylacetoacetate hydrolase family protein [Pandoraea terrae]VVD87313.1 hydratase/decarboxylase [Pandoraea terrae]
MNAANISTVAAALAVARRERRTLDTSHFAAALESEAEAYAVQAEVARLMGWESGRAGQYWKSGGPTRDSVLTQAELPAVGVWQSPANAGDWHFTHRGIEAEIALRIGRDVDAVMAAALVGNAATALVDAMAVSIEIVDSRWDQYLDAPARLKLADLQSHGALVLGEWRPFERRDWAAQTCRVQIGETVTERRGTHPLGDPAFCLTAWLRHATRDGRVVPAGSVVTTGTWAGILDAAAGELVTVDFEGIGRASVQL